MNKISSSQLHQALRADLSRRANIFITDADYASVNSRWMTGTFYNAYRSWCMKNFVMSWETFDDCDNKSTYLRALINIAHSNSMRKRQRRGQPTVQGVAVGEIFYHIDGDRNRGHAINWFYSDDCIQYLEPQNGRILNLTKTEKESVWYARA